MNQREVRLENLEIQLFLILHTFTRKLLLQTMHEYVRKRFNIYLTRDHRD